MNFPMLKRLPCSVCGLSSLHHDGWFLVMENRWLDHLKILTWHSALATGGQVKCACCRQHLKVLIAYWLEEATLRLAAPSYGHLIPLAGNPEGFGTDLDPQEMGRLVGELSVSREPLSSNWAGSPETLECILDALIPESNESQSTAAESTGLEVQAPVPPMQQAQVWPGPALD